MKIIAIAVSSVNGRITDGKSPNIHSWTSKEDSEFFSKMRSGAKLIVMGSGTYEAERELIRPDNERLRIVLTKNPQNYSKNVISGQLEFSDEEPKALVARLESSGYDEMLLVGGSEIYAAFLKENLINALYLTIEPYIFGDGKPLFAKGDFGAQLELVEMQKLNSRGTILLKYNVKNYKI